MIFYELLAQAHSSHMVKNAAALRSPGENLENRCLRAPFTTITYCVLNNNNKNEPFLIVWMVVFLLRELTLLTPI